PRLERNLERVRTPRGIYRFLRDALTTLWGMTQVLPRCASGFNPEARGIGVLPHRARLCSSKSVSGETPLCRENFRGRLSLRSLLPLQLGPLMPPSTPSSKRGRQPPKSSTNPFANYSATIRCKCWTTRVRFSANYGSVRNCQ